MVEAAPIVFVVDDDISVRESLELLIRKQGWHPETFISAHEFLTKPFSNEALLGAIRNAIERSRVKLDNETEIRKLRARYSALTMRERQVMTLVASGMLNKQVGDELGITEITVKFHRGNLMRKMKADSFAELVNMAARLRITGSSTVKVPAAWH